MRISSPMPSHLHDLRVCQLEPMFLVWEGFQELFFQLLQTLKDSMLSTFVTGLWEPWKSKNSKIWWEGITMTTRVVCTLANDTIRSWTWAQNNSAAKQHSFARLDVWLLQLV